MIWSAGSNVQYHLRVSILPIEAISETSFDFSLTSTVVAVRVTSQPRSQVMPNSNIPMLFQAYELRLLAIFKDDEKAIKANSRGFNKVSLYTAPAFPSSSCSVTLQLGSFYVLSGKFKDGNLYTRFCDRREKWTDFSETRLTELRERYRNYSKGCECWIGPFCFLYPKSRCGLRGCNGYDVNIDFACRKTFQRCEKLDETKCAWTGRRCDRNLKEMP